MNTQNAFVFRISKGNDSGSPKGNCPLDYAQAKEVISNLKQEEITPIDYDNNGHLDFIHDELWQKHILRQGWGIADLDLVQDVKPWIENYMISGKIFWDADIDCNAAKGRWNILKRMKNIKANDILLIPKTSSVYLNDYNVFTVCQVDSAYYFDCPNNIQDFGHCLKVKNIQEFKYGEKTLERSDFGTPYLWAITQIKNYHSRYRKIKDFIHSEYNIVI